jgi:TrmH family RNA methyltransferase
MSRPAWHSDHELLRRVQSRRGRQQTGHFALEGVRLHERALRAGVPLRFVFCSERFATSADPRTVALRADLAAAGVVCHVVPPELLTPFTGERGLGEIVGVAALPDSADYPPFPGTPPFLLILADIVDPGNVGALIRTAHALGVSGVIAVGVSDPWHPRAVRTSMGSLFRLPILTAPAPGPLLARLAEEGVQRVAAFSADGIPLPAAVFSRHGRALCVGNEYAGLPEESRNAFDLCVTIPMSPDIDSFSVNAATAILLYGMGG